MQKVLLLALSKSKHFAKVNTKVLLISNMQIKSKVRLCNDTVIRPYTHGVTRNAGT